MTDKTDSKERGSIISSSDILLHDAKTALLYEELRAAIDDGHESMTHADALAEIAAIRAENEKLHADLAAIGAGGVNGPLMGRASLAANAGSEPVAPDGWLHENGLLYRLTDERHPCNRDEINVTMADGSRSIESRSRLALELLDRIRATHPSPPEGMVGGWISVDERLPPPFEEVVVYPRPDDYCCEAFCDTAGKWKWAEYEHNFGVHHRECQVEYWLMLPEVPAPPTTSAGSGKGE